MSNRLSFYNLLTEKEKELVKDNTIERTYKKGSIVFNNSSSCLGLVNVLKGQIRAYLVSDEGEIYWLDRDKLESVELSLPEVMIICL